MSGTTRLSCFFLHRTTFEAHPKFRHIHKKFFQIKAFMWFDLRMKK